MHRRSFLSLLGTSAAAWPLAARAQQGERVRRVGVLFNAAEGDANQKANLAALLDGLAKLGWAEGRNLRVDVRFATGDPARIRGYAAELVSLAPDVIVTTPTPATIAVQQQTKTIPIVFTAGGDPVLNGVVRSIARPEGNTTGFSALEVSIAGKWLELLKEAAPRCTRVALLFNPNFLSNVVAAYISVIEAAAATLALQTIKVPVRDARDRRVRGGAQRRLACTAAWAEWRQSRNGHSAGGAAPTARDLQRSQSYRRRRPDVLWARCA
jgi:ABC-type uncharacterized transport system substrate-binding protein